MATPQQKRADRRVQVLVALLGCLLALVPLGVLLTLRLSAPLPPPSVSVTLPPVFVPAPGVAPPIPLPAGGSFAISSDADGALAEVRPATVRPVGSVAKAMTALVVLEHRPLSTRGDGPVLTMTAADVALFDEAVRQQGSALRVTAGERLSERQLLLALMLPSANNIAETLALWVGGGTRDGFIELLNRRAAELGMSQTHFADPSGYSPATRSSAGDLVLLGQAALRNPAFVEIVGTREATLPGGEVLRNLDTLLATEPGWLGIKTGWTPAAGGCLLFSARQSYAPGAQPVTLVGAVLGQPSIPAADPPHPELGGAFEAAAAAVSAALNGYTAVDAGQLRPRLRGTVTTRWGSRADLVLGRFSRPVVVVRTGEGLLLSMTPTRSGLDTGAPLATVRATSVGRLVGTWQVLAAGGLTGPSPWWRLWNA